MSTATSPTPSLSPHRRGGIVLLYPPITDPTTAYHSLVYVGSAARAHGFDDVEIVDTNVEALAFCGRADTLHKLRDEWVSRLRALSGRPFLTPLEQLEYRYLVPAVELDPAAVAAAIATMRRAESFYDYPTYREAVEVLGAWLRALSCAGFPGQFGHDYDLSMRNLYNPYSVKDLTDRAILDRLARPLEPYYSSVLFPRLMQQRPSVVGINVTYTAQLPFALWLLRELRDKLPDAYLACGGTSVSNSWKNIDRPENFGAIFRAADACVVGDGETPFVRLLEAHASSERPTALPNTVIIDRRSGGVTPPDGLHYEDLDALPTPDYGLMSYEQYFSPHPLVYYSPTRGCYWNRCTFCDYGLNFGSPTSPWRQRSIDRCVEDLRAASAITRYVYLSVDVLAPAPLVKFCKRLAEEQVGIRWAAEVRLEKSFSEEACRALRDSGCVCVSVGFESGSQRILDLMDKGIKLESVAETIANFSRAGIRVQMMGFTGFPTETYDEAMATFEFLEAHREHWATSGIGRFGLTPGAIVAGRADEHALERYGPLEGDAIRYVWVFEERNRPAMSERQRRRLTRARRSLRGAEFSRPYTGGIDAAHSIFYYDRYGDRFPADIGQGGDPLEGGATLQPNGRVIAAPPFHPLRAFGRRSIRAIHSKIRRQHRRRPAHAELSTLAASHPMLEPTTDPTPIFVRADGKLIGCSEEAAAILQQFELCPASVSGHLESVADDATRKRHEAVLRMMFDVGMLRATEPAPGAPEVRRQRPERLIAR